MKSETLTELAKAQDELENFTKFIENSFNITKTTVDNSLGDFKVSLLDYHSSRQNTGKLPTIKFSTEEKVDIGNFIVSITKKHLENKLELAKKNFKEELVKDI